MNIRWGKIIGRIFFVGAVMVFVSGCASSSKLWYKAGNNQVDFDLDHNECNRIAEEVGRQATMSGETINPEVFNVSYNNCLFSRGWTHTPPGTGQENTRTVELVTVKGNRILVFDRQMTLPAGFNLISNQVSGFEDVRQQALLFQGPGSVYLSMVVQEAFSRQFDPVEYPVNEPFFVFEKGEAGRKRLPTIWTVFTGAIKAEWVAGIGAYYPVEKNKRINIAMTRGIPPQDEPPPQGLRLTKIQKEAIESFSDQWLESVKTGFGAGEKSATGEKDNLMMRTGKKIINKIGSFL